MSISQPIFGNTLDPKRIRFDPDDVVEAIHGRGFAKRTELDRVVLYKRPFAPLIVSLRYPLFEKQVRRYLGDAGFTPAEIDAFVVEQGRRYDPKSFRSEEPPFSPD